MECLALLLAENAANAADFRRAGGARAVHNMVALTSQRWQALRVAQQLILGDDSPRAHDDLGTLLELMQSTPPQAYGVKIDILRTVIRLFSLDARVKHLFRQVRADMGWGGGAPQPRFPFPLQLPLSCRTLTSLHFLGPWLCVRRPCPGDADRCERAGLFSAARRKAGRHLVQRRAPPKARPAPLHPPHLDMCLAKLSGQLRRASCGQCPDEPLSVHDSLFFFWSTCSLVAADSSPPPHPPTAQAFAAEVRYETLADSIQVSGIMSVPEDALEVCDCLLVMAAEAFGREEEWEHRGLPLKNAHVVSDVVVPLLVNTTPPTQEVVLHRILSLARGEGNAQRLAEAGTTGALVSNFGTALRDAADPLHATVMELFTLLGARSLTPQELRMFLRLDTKHMAQVPPARALEEAAQEEPDEAVLALLQTLQERMNDKGGILSGAGLQGGAAKDGPMAPACVPDVSEEHLQALVAIAKAQDAGGATPFIEFDMAAPRGYASTFVPSVAQLSRGNSGAAHTR